MNRATLVEKSELFADAPNAVAKVRELVLACAVQGKLVPQDPADEPAQTLLQTIDTEREQLIRQKKIRPQAPLGLIGEKDSPFPVPDLWQWRHLADVCFLITDGAHHTPRYEAKGVPFLSVKDVSSGTIDFSNTRFISEDAHRELCKRCRPEQGDILLTKVGTTGIAVTVDEGREFSIFVSLALLKFSHKHLNRHYLKHLINSPFVKQLSADNTQGIGNKNLVLRLIKQFPVPIPPLAEQKRIVAKVDELMALCDRLEAQQQEREMQHNALARASLARFADAPTPANLNLLFHKSYTIPTADIRQSILTLAVQGKLVPQDPDDEPAQILIERIAAAREQVPFGKRAKRADRTRDLDSSKFACDIPETWVWCRLGHLVLDFRYGTSRKCDRDSSGVPVLRIPNIQNGRIDSTDLKFTRMPSSEFEELRLRDGDLLLVRSNGSENLVGRSAVASAGDERFAYAGYLVRARIPQDAIFTPFLHIALSTPLVRGQIESPLRTTSGVKNINTTELSNLSLPLPPLAEQHRIVAKVDRLMALVAQLEAQLASSRATAEKLIEALVTELTKPAKACNGNTDTGSTDRISISSASLRDYAGRSAAASRRPNAHTRP